MIRIVSQHPSAGVKQDKMDARMLGLFSAGMLLVLAAGFSTTYATPEVL